MYANIYIYRERERAPKRPACPPTGLDLPGQKRLLIVTIMIIIIMIRYNYNNNNKQLFST